MSTESGLDIFEGESEQRPGKPVRGGIGAILALIAVMGLIVVLVGGAILGIANAVLWLASPTEVAQFALSDASCRIVGSEVLVDARLDRGPHYDEDRGIAGYDWEPDVAHSRDPGGGDVGDRVTFTAPVSQVSQVQQLVLYVPAGEPALKQTFAMRVAIAGGTCTVDVG